MSLKALKTKVLGVPEVGDLMKRCKLTPDEWQVQAVVAPEPLVVLNCCRQAGKSTVAAFRALREALCGPFHLVLLTAPTLRQAENLLDTVKLFHLCLRDVCKKSSSSTELVFTQDSRIVALPCAPDNLRGFSNVDLVIIDEAARAPDELYRALRPMLALSQGQLMLLSTPNGKRGFFYELCRDRPPEAVVLEVPASRIDRISAEFLERERQALGPVYFRQEYECGFESMQGAVYPDFERLLCGLAGLATGEDALSDTNPAFGRDRRCGLRHLTGGLDFGYRNPAAAVWGGLDVHHVLHLEGELYAPRLSLEELAARLPRGVLWHADPSEPQSIRRLVELGHAVRPAKNAIVPGISSVAYRLRLGLLRADPTRCPNLIRESCIYHYDETVTLSHELPVPGDDHAMDALRYLCMGLVHQLPRVREPILAGD